MFIRKEMRFHNMSINTKYQDKIATKSVLIDRETLKARWGVSIPTIQRREKDGTLNPIYIPGGRLVRYRLEDIEQIEQESIRKEAV